jgi:hypothetical protein
MAQLPKKGTPQKAQRPVVKSPKAAENVAPLPPSKNEKIFIYSVLAAYFVIGLIGVFHHEMWRDELQIWLVGASAHNISEFLRNMTNECNPLGWYSIDFILSRFTDSPLIVQIFHLLLATGSIYLILRYAPFNRLQKVLVSFSYYLFFEYSLIARGYALTIFFIFLFCVAYQQVKSKNRYAIISLILFCLANTTGHGLIMTLSLLGMMIADYLFTHDVSLRKKYTSTQFLIGVIIALIGVYIAFRWITPPANNNYGNRWFTAIDTQRMGLSLRTFWMSLIPIPQLSTVNFWSSNMFYTATTSPSTFKILFVLSLFIFLFCVLNYSQKISIAVFYLSGTLGVLLFHYANNVIFIINAANHYGFIFITFIVAAWLAPGVKKSKFAIPILSSFRNKLNIEKYFPYLVTALFGINMIGGVIAYSKDYSLLFSNIEVTGNYIVSHHLDKLPETGFIDYAVSPISSITKQPIYFPDRDTTGRFTISVETRHSFDMNVLAQRVANFVSHQKDSVLFISTGDYFGIGDERVIDNIQYTKIASFFGSVVIDEVYILYIARKFDLNRLMQDSASFRNPGIVNSMLSVANDMVQNGRLDDAAKVLLTVQERTHGAAIPHLHNYLGMLYSKENKPADAEKEFNTEIGLNLQKEEAFFNLGMLYFQNKDYDRAITAWDSTISINPKNINAYNNLGVCYLNLKQDNDKALIYFEKSVELDPNYTQGYYNILICSQNKNDEQAIIKYTRILLDRGTSINDIKAKGINISDALLQKINAR